MRQHKLHDSNDTEIQALKTVYLFFFLARGRRLQFCSSIVHTVLFNTIPDCWNSIYVCHDCGLCVVLFLCLCFASVCSEVFRRGWAWSSCVSHTYSPSNHQHRLRYSGPLSTRCQIVYTRRRSFYGWTTCAASGDFLLLWHFVESRDSFLKTPHHPQSPCYLRALLPSLLHLCRQTNLSVDPPASRSPVPPTQPRPPSAMSPRYTLCCATSLSLSTLFTTTSNLNKFLSTFPLSWCPLLGPIYKT